MAQTFKTVVAPVGTTNVLEVASGQVVRVVNLGQWTPNYGTENTVRAELAGLEWTVWKQDVFQGPMKFMLYAEGEPAFITVEYLPDATSPDRTLILPQGTNAVAVSLEVSTNLTHWATATNGVYVPGETPRFFRIKAAQ